MAAQSIAQAAPSLHATLSGTTADVVTIAMSARRQVRVTNRSTIASPLDLWVWAMDSASGTAVTAAVAGSIYVPPGQSRMVGLVPDTTGASYLSIVGAATPYSVELA